MSRHLLSGSCLPSCSTPMCAEQSLTPWRCFRQRRGPFQPNGGRSGQTYDHALDVLHWSLTHHQDFKKRWPKAFSARYYAVGVRQRGQPRLYHGFLKAHLISRVVLKANLLEPPFYIAPIPHRFSPKKQRHDASSKDALLRSIFPCISDFLHISSLMRSNSRFLLLNLRSYYI